jgi:energy-coupling factor transport system permease protein
MIEKHLSTHPAAKLFMAISFITLILSIPVIYRSVVVLMGALIVWGVLKPSKVSDPGRIFIRLWLTAGLFLFLMHGLTFNGGMGISHHGLTIAIRNFLNIGSLMVSFLWMTRSIKAEEFYSMLIDFHLPISLIYIVFQAIYLIPKFGVKSKDILVAQQARGFPLKGLRNTLRILPLIFSPLFSSMIYELEENAASVAARGLYAPGQKTHLCEIRFKLFDGVLVATSVLIMLCGIVVLN